MLAITDHYPSRNRAGLQHILLSSDVILHVRNISEEDIDMWAAEAVKIHVSTASNHLHVQIELGHSVRSCEIVIGLSIQVQRWV